MASKTARPSPFSASPSHSPRLIRPLESGSETRFTQTCIRARECLLAELLRAPARHEVSMEVRLPRVCAAAKCTFLVKEGKLWVQHLWPLLCFRFRAVWVLIGSLAVRGARL